MGTLRWLLKQADGGDAGALMGGAALAGGVGAGAYFLGKSHGQEAVEEAADEVKPKKAKKPKATPDAVPAPEAAATPTKGTKANAKALAKAKGTNVKGTFTAPNVLPGMKKPKPTYVPAASSISKAPLAEGVGKGLKSTAMKLVGKVATGGHVNF